MHLRPGFPHVPGFGVAVPQLPGHEMINFLHQVAAPVPLVAVAGGVPPPPAVPAPATATKAGQPAPPWHGDANGKKSFSKAAPGGKEKKEEVGRIGSGSVSVGFFKVFPWFSISFVHLEVRTRSQKEAKEVATGLGFSAIEPSAEPLERAECGAAPGTRQGGQDGGEELISHETPRVSVNFPCFFHDFHVISM